MFAIGVWFAMLFLMTRRVNNKFYNADIYADFKPSNEIGLLRGPL